MLIRRFAVRTLSLAMTVLAAGVVSGQDYPNKPIRIITSQPGGGTDFGTRLIAQGISGPLGQQVIVENRGGGSGAIAGEMLAKAKPDGYTLLSYGPAIWVLPLLRRNVPYDPMKDFSPIALTDKSPNVLVVHPSVPVKSVKELIALAKARPGELDYARAAAGGPTHLSAELFKVMVGVNIVSVPYRGGGPAVLGLLGGEAHLMFATAPSVAPHVKAGKLRALAVTSAEPSMLFPGVPTVARTAPGFSSELINGMFAPAGTPAAIIERLNQEIVQFLNREEVKKRFFNGGSEIVASSPEQYGATVKSEVTKWGKVIKDAGIRDE